MKTGCDVGGAWDLPASCEMAKCCVSGVEPSVSDLPLLANSCQSRMTSNRTSSWTYWIKHRWQIIHPQWQLLWKKAWLFLFFSPKPSDRLRNPHNLIVNEYQGISPRIERARIEDDRPLPSGEVQTTQHAVMACSSLQLVLSALFCTMYLLYHFWITK